MKNWVGEAKNRIFRKKNSVQVTENKSASGDLNNVYGSIKFLTRPGRTRLVRNQKWTMLSHVCHYCKTVVTDQRRCSVFRGTRSVLGSLNPLYRPIITFLDLTWNGRGELWNVPGISKYHMQLDISFLCRNSSKRCKERKSRKKPYFKENINIR